MATTQRRGESEETQPTVYRPRPLENVLGEPKPKRCYWIGLTNEARELGICAVTLAGHSFANVTERIIRSSAAQGITDAVHRVPHRGNLALLSDEELAAINTALEVRVVRSQVSEHADPRTGTDTHSKPVRRSARVERILTAAEVAKMRESDLVVPPTPVLFGDRALAEFVYVRPSAMSPHALSEPEPAPVSQTGIVSSGPFIESNCGAYFDDAAYISAGR